MISVVIPTYNREKTIMRSLNSVFCQTYEDYEIVIVDDCSTDGTEELIKGLNDRRIQYVKKTVNEGAAAARNTGVSNAKGEWIAFLDSDDVWHKDKLKKQIEYATKHPEYDMIYCGYIGYHEDGRVTQTPDRDNMAILEGDIFLPLLVKNSIGAPTILVKKDAFDSTGGFNTEYKCLEDWEFAIKFAKNYKIGFVDDNLMDAYISNSGVSSRITEYFDARCRMVGSYRDELLESNLFNTVVGDILTRTTKYGISEIVEKMLAIYLQS